MQHFQTVIARHGAGGYAQHLKIVEYVRFDTGKRAFAAAKLSASMEKVMYLYLTSPLLPLESWFLSISEYSARMELKASSRAECR